MLMNIFDDPYERQRELNQNLKQSHFTSVGLQKEF